MLKHKVRNVEVVEDLGFKTVHTSAVHDFQNTENATGKSQKESTEEDREGKSLMDVDCKEVVYQEVEQCRIIEKKNTNRSGSGQQQTVRERTLGPDLGKTMNWWSRRVYKATVNTSATTSRLDPKEKKVG